MAWWAWYALALIPQVAALVYLLARRRRADRQIGALAERLRQLGETLEDRIAAQTSELAVAAELAQAANRAKSEFLANTSHEIRTPLNAVLGLTEVVLGTELTAFQRDHLRTVLDSGDALLHLINELLDFSKIEAGKMAIERVPFHLEDAVCDTLKALAIRAQSKGLELSCFVDPAAPTQIVGDPIRLRQVITNLVHNAIAYTERGEVFVRVACPPPMSELHVAVLDSGIGIQPDDLSRLFEAFQQGDSSTTRRYGGTGLGLAICKRLVALMGGAIRAESEPGVGSTFSFTLPLAVLPGSPLRERGAHAVRALIGVRVLIVDDNTTNRTILTWLARWARMRPEATSSAAEAFAVLQATQASADPIRAAIVDVHMPEMDGFALVERVRRHPELGDIPVVFLTSAVEDSELHDCERVRGTTRLMKPVKQSELIDALAHAIDPGGAAAADASARAAHAPPDALVPERSDVPRGMHVLLAEDSVANRKLAIAILESEGHRAEVAETGRRAVEACARERFDVVLMDVQMPEMDGFAATVAIRDAEDGTGEHVPIIAMTAHALHGDRERCLSAGMDDYVSKPLRRRDLVHALARVAESQRAKAAAE